MRCGSASVAFAIALLCCATKLVAATPEPSQKSLRVCADPNNLPFSNDRGEGFENKLADLVASDLGMAVSYTWWAQRRGFIRNTLKAGKCDVVIGTPALDMIDVTQPYYRSGYVFVSRASDEIRFTSLLAPELRTLRVGVQLIGDDGFNTPPAHALGAQHITDNVKGFLVYGDYRTDSPPSRIVEAVADGAVDVAAVWGPLAGYYATRSRVPLRVVAISGTEAFRPLRFDFSISMGVRKGDDALKARLDDVIARRKREIEAIIDAYGVPRF
jgi:quinoprotein dehydrogenase-associated probable ABC transporter substrate-binding protein